jgi:hypothetical protein
MTIADQKKGMPIIALFCTRGMETFLANSIRGILQVGIDPGSIYVGCPNNAFKIVSDVARGYSDHIHIVSDQKPTDVDDETQNYSCFGTRSFTDISWKKVVFIREQIELHRHIVYADLDVGWIRNPLPYLIQVAQVYPMAFQTEGLPRFPPALCFGFASFTKSARTNAFLDALIELDDANRRDGNRLNDQAVCQNLIESDASWWKDIFFLPEALFLNGLGYRNLQKSVAPCPMDGELLPFLFHANWTVGADRKHNLLAQAGLWFDSDSTESAVANAGDPSDKGSSGLPI